MSELQVIDVDKMADVRSLSGQFYRKSEVDDVISTIKSERDKWHKRWLELAEKFKEA